MGSLYFLDLPKSTLEVGFEYAALALLVLLIIITQIKTPSHGGLSFSLKRSLITCQQNQATNQSNKRAASSLNTVIATKAIAIRQTTSNTKLMIFPIAAPYGVNVLIGVKGANDCAIATSLLWTQRANT